MAVKLVLIWRVTHFRTLGYSQFGAVSIAGWTAKAEKVIFGREGGSVLILIICVATHQVNFHYYRFLKGVFKT